MNKTPNRKAVPQPAAGQMIFGLLHAAQTLEDKLEAALGEAGLSTAKYGVLSQLAGAAEPLTLGELATRLSCVRSNMTQLVDRLESDGLVRRLDDAHDRRIIRAELTALGAKRQAAGAKVVDRVQAELAELMSDSDRRMLERVMTSLG